MYTSTHLFCISHRSPQWLAAVPQVSASGPLFNTVEVIFQHSLFPFSVMPFWSVTGMLQRMACGFVALVAICALPSYTAIGGGLASILLCWLFAKTQRVRAIAAHGDVMDSKPP
jgi:hypothetical protein